MKTRVLVITLLVGVAAFYLPGCGSGPVGAVDISGVEAAFALGTPERVEVNKAETIILAGDYPTALSSLRNLASMPTLTAAQEEALKNLIAAVEAKIAGGASPAAEKIKNTAGETESSVQKAAGDLQKPVGK